MKTLVRLAAPRSAIGFGIRLVAYIGLIVAVFVVQELLRFGPPEIGWAIYLSSVVVTGLPFVVLFLALLRHSRMLQEQMAVLAHTDTLTGLPNRRAFVDQAGPPKGQGDVLMAVDVDHFKRINDSYGHEAGDRALIRVAEALREQLRDGDLVARLGGEEFVILLRDAPVAAAQRVAERIAAGVAVELAPGVTETLTLSVGVTERVNALDLPEAMRQADLALYRAKADGRARAVIWSPCLVPAIG